MKTLKLTCVKMGINGEGIAYDQRIPVFCDGVFPGETALVEITEEAARYKKGKSIKILSPSSYRHPSPCGQQEICGGCPLMPMDYTQQSIQKRQLLVEALRKYAHIDPGLIRNMHASPVSLGWRNSCKVPLGKAQGKTVTGMYQPGSNHFLPIQDCPQHSPELEKARKAILQVMDQYNLPIATQKDPEGCRYLILRVLDQQIQCTFITTKMVLPQAFVESLSQIPQMASIHQSVNIKRKGTALFGKETKRLWGKETITVSLCGLCFQLSPESFFQMNTEMAKQLYTMTMQKVDPCETLVEAYCGTGAMALMACAKAQHVIGIESVAQAVNNAKENAMHNGLEDQALFTCLDAAKGLQSTLQRISVDTLLMDPPRSGCDPEMIQTILDSSIPRVLYISCNPATLGQNLSQLLSVYNLRTVIPFDLFPNTPHVESLSVLERKKSL